MGKPDPKAAGPRTTWWTNACRACGAALSPVPADAHPSTGARPWRLCGRCAAYPPDVREPEPELWDPLAVTGDSASAKDLSGR